MIWIDWVVLFSTFAVVLSVGALMSKRGGRNTKEFILAGRSLPWWLAGTAMIASAYNADSPLHQSRKARQDGLAGCWLYWSGIISSVVNSLMMAKLWRRAGITTPIEFVDIRYHGEAKKWTRIYGCIYASFITGTIFVALGLLGMRKVIEVILSPPATFPFLGMNLPTSTAIVLGAVTVAMIYSTASGIWGVVINDSIEFLIAIGSSYLLTMIVYSKVGWADGLRENLSQMTTSSGGSYLNIMPELGLTLLVWWLIQPLTSIDGNDQINARYLTARDEREAVLSGFWRIVNHFALRAWPWYICGFCALALFPEMTRESEGAYPRLIKEFMPAGLRGLMLAGFFGAFMSSIGTGMINSASIFVNDLYRPYIRPRASDRHYVWATRVSIIAYAFIGCAFALTATSILDLVKVFIQLNSALGVIYTLRWFWWRINIWTDIANQLVALPVTLFFYQNNEKRICNALGLGDGVTPWIMSRLHLTTADDSYGLTYLLILFFCACVWVPVMLLTKPDPEKKLIEFYRRVRPYGWWGPIKRKCPDVEPDNIWLDLRLILLGWVFSFCFLFGVGSVFLGKFTFAAGLLAVAAFSGWHLITRINRHYSTTRANPEEARAGAESGA